MSVAADRRIDRFGRLVGGAERRQRIQLDADADRREFLAREQRRGTEFGDVGEHRHLQRVDELLVRRQIVGSLGENRVGTGFGEAIPRSIAASTPCAWYASVPPLREKSGSVFASAAALSRLEEHTSELQSLIRLSYSVFRL